MSNANYIDKIKKLPEPTKQFVGLVALMLVIFCSFFILNNIFGEGGVEKTAKEFNKDFLGKIPLHQDLRISADKGMPLTLSDTQHEISLIFQSIATKILEKFNH